MATKGINICSVDGCNRIHEAKGFCELHYRRQRKGLNLKRQLSIDFVEQAAVKASQGFEKCIIWPFATNRGYGQFKFQGKHFSAHRYALIYYSMENPKDLIACHGPCHKRLCVNPLHLYWGTHADNAEDMKRDGTQRFGEKVNTNKLSESQVISILQRKKQSNVEIAKEFAVSPSTIRLIRIGKNWKHLQGAAQNG